MTLNLHQNISNYIKNGESYCITPFHALDFSIRKPGMNVLHTPTSHFIRY